MKLSCFLFNANTNYILVTEFPDLMEFKSNKITYSSAWFNFSSSVRSLVNSENITQVHIAINKIKPMLPQINPSEAQMRMLCQ